MTFQEKTEKVFIQSVKQGIDEYLKFLNSDIDLPLDKEGNVNEMKLAQVVEARADAVDGVYVLIDEVNLKNLDKKFIDNQIISGLKTTFYELLEIIKRPMPRFNHDDPITDEDVNHFSSEDGFNDLLSIDKPNYTDDKIKAISKAKKIATKTCNTIRLKISVMQDSETINKQKVENKKITSIPERFAQRNA